jgi:hypothetical protein
MLGPTSAEGVAEGGDHFEGWKPTKFRCYQDITSYRFADTLITVTSFSAKIKSGLVAANRSAESIASALSYHWRR